MIVASSRGAELLWVVLPYVAITTFVVGHAWRWRTDQVTWTSRSTQLLESRWLKLGSPLFHFGLLAVIGGHVLGILVPESWTAGIGLSESAYHVVSVLMGTLAGSAMLAGLVILIIRRLRDPRVQATTRGADIAVMVLLAFMVATGMWNTIIENLVNGGYNYRETVSPWFRGLFLLTPDPALMSGDAVPLSYQLHATGAWILLIVWPFSRLVHAWSVPVGYLRRRNIVYRSRVPLAARVGADGIDSDSENSTRGGRHVRY